MDSLVVVEGSKGKGGRFYADAITMPDIPSRKPATTGGRRAYAVLLSDLHIGSKMFLQEDFGRFVSWLNGKLGDLDIVSRIKYVVIAGDVVDGIGVYPGQEFQLMERDLKRQFSLAAEILSGIPKHIKIAAMVFLGYPVRAYGPPTRPPVAEVFHRDGW